MHVRELIGRDVVQDLPDAVQPIQMLGLHQTQAGHRLTGPNVGVGDGQGSASASFTNTVGYERTSHTHEPVQRTKLSTAILAYSGEERICSSYPQPRLNQQRK